MSDQTVIKKTISSTEASNRFGTMLSEAASGKSLFVVTRMGKPQGVFLGVDQFREMLEMIETFEELHDVRYMQGIFEAREEIQLGETLTLDDLDRALGL